MVSQASHACQPIQAHALGTYRQQLHLFMQRVLTNQACAGVMWPPSYQMPMTKTLKRPGQQRKKLYQGSLCLVDASGINRISPTLVTPLFGAGASEKDVMPMHACVNPTP